MRATESQNNISLLPPPANIALQLDSVCFIKHGNTLLLYIIKTPFSNIERLISFILANERFILSSSQNTNGK